jgi:methyl-accepting chemotaxis protein/aerotaxis receptor
MRLNEPITDREVVVPDDAMLVSATDTGSRIRFANAAFVKVSGFSAAELEGAPHNLVRHPHMPEAAFADLWSVLKAGRPWEGLVKNRTKSGDHYWVRANVTPVVEAGKVTGYVSIRTRPSQQETTAAEAAYASMRAGGKEFTLRDGELVRTGWRSRLRDGWFSVTARMAAAGAASLLAVVAVGWLGLSGMRASNDGLQSVYRDRTLPAMQLAEIRDLTRDNLLQLAVMPTEIHGQVPVTARAAVMRANSARIAEVWAEYLATEMVPEETTLIERLTKARAEFVREGLEPGLALAERGEADALEKHLREKVIPLSGPPIELNLALSRLQARVAAEVYSAAETSYGQRFWAVLGASLFGLAGMASLGVLAFLGMRRPLREVEGHLDDIAQGDFATCIASPATPEFRRTVAQLRALRARLAYAAQERSELDQRAAEERGHAVLEMASTVEQEARSAVEAVAQRTSNMAAQAEQVAGAADRLGGNAAAAAQSAERAMANTQSVAAATEQLSASISEIATQTARSSEVVGRAVQGGRAAEATIASLAEAAGRVNDVVRLIGDVAAKTNLLALNATIEAARAGEAGKGFAVVAGEVKQLAAQTAQATGDITRQLSDIQQATGAAVRAVADMSQAIGEISETTTAIAAAIEEQGAATQEIARNVASNGDEVRDMASRIEAVARDAGQAGAQAANVRDEVGTVDAEVRALREGLVRVVRTSMTEAERRSEPRYPATEPCIISLPDGRRMEGTALDVSAHGTLVGGLTAVPVGTTGTLELPRYGARVAFTVRDAGMRGIHLRLADDSISAEYRRAFEALAGKPYPPDEAARAA